jgi:hypothetical protein
MSDGNIFQPPHPLGISRKQWFRDIPNLSVCRIEHRTLFQKAYFFNPDTIGLEEGRESKAISVCNCACTVALVQRHEFDDSQLSDVFVKLGTHIALNNILKPLQIGKIMMDWS